MSAVAVDTSWHPPSSTTGINNLDEVLDGDGVFGFIFDSSHTPTELYGRYNYCNMPHVRRTEYRPAPEGYELVYVEVIHRHHKRTPNQANTFPVEGYSWDCDDTKRYYYGQPIPGHSSATTFWQVDEAPLNPFTVSGFNGTCSFPQITDGGLEDSWQHGRDLFEVYHDLLGFLPDNFDDARVQFRVTNNGITSQVAGMVINGMYKWQQNVPLLVQRDSIDSLDPAYSCPAGQAMFRTITDGQTESPWKSHLTRSQLLFDALDAISGVPSDATDWHESYDHYFDNLASRLCHGKPLPCKVDDPSTCIDPEQADAVFRLGQFEYSYMYRDAPASLAASSAIFGVWIGELAQHIREKTTRDGNGRPSPVIYRHNIAHDGSLAKLLSILQIDEMVWPGMGAEVVFELY
ncbi:hypothetical protein VTN96DRAFT_831 [Rasamsonia emersonii]